ncbi:MAG: nucleotide exchange factor GrpE [Candidatus Shapirobacteria bacterium]|nr:nucleotide exchange factor GrpE [Candidatus Shapirobacteria bacterium]
MVKKTQKQTVRETKELQQRLEKLEEQLKRALADYDNLEKRIGRERKAWIDSAGESLVDKLLFVFDDLERACQNIVDEPGLKMIRDQFWQVLNSEGVEKITTQNKTFDPQLMDAQSMVPGSKEKIIEEICPGYLYRGRCLRPAKVKVGQGKK